MTMLGEGWTLSTPEPAPAPPEEDLLALRLELVLTALDGLAQSLKDLPTPQVFIDAPDLSAIVQAVNGLKPGADADQIAQAVVRQIAPTAQKPEPDAVYSELVTALQALDFRLQGAGSHTAAITLPNDSTRLLGHVTVDAMPPVTVDTTLLAKDTTLTNGTQHTVVDNFPATQPVSGTFWQATQPVSLATNTPDVTDRAARLLGHVTVDNASIPVTGTFWQATQPVSLAGTVTVDTELPAAAAVADATANPTAPFVAGANHVFNGTSWDRQRGMGVATTTGDTGAKTATGNGATQTNVGNKGVSIVIALGTVSGTSPTCVFKVQSSVDGGTTWVDIPGAATASLTATGNFGIDIFPGVAVTAGTTTSGTKTVANQILPRTWRIVWTIGGVTPSFTITSITYNYIAN